MNIRVATLDDYDGLLALDTVFPQEPERAQQIHSWMQLSDCYVLEKDGALLAYGVLSHQFFGHDFVEMLMVGAEGRRQGLGSALLHYFRQISGTEKLFSSTNQSNQAMQRLFLKLGFQHSGVIDNLDENDPEIVFVSLSRQLPGQ